MPVKARYNCLVVLGPTASGKTALAAEIAGLFGGEIISADSRQVYRHLDIGTGKDLGAYVYNGKKIPFHLIGIADPDRQFFLHDFVRALEAAFSDISERGKLPVICGGTGLYLDALRKHYSLTQVPENEGLRNDLAGLSKESLVRRLESFPSAQVAQVDKTSVKRLIRGIEIAEYLRDHKLTPDPELPYVPFYVGIDPPRPVLLKNISARLQERLDAGMVEEARGLLKMGITHERLQALGLEYKYLGRFLRGEISCEVMREELFVAIRQYARRQMTWFRRMEREGVKIHWLESPVLTAEMAEKIRAAFAE